MQRFDLKHYCLLLAVFVVSGGLIFAAFKWRLPPASTEPNRQSNGGLPPDDFNLSREPNDSFSTTFPSLGEPWNSSTPPQRQLAIAVVKAHLDAFKSGRYEHAMSYQTSELSRSFTSLVKFRDIIEKRYPMFTNFREVHFGSSLSGAHGKYMTLNVELRGGDRDVTQALYQLVREGGHLRISGVSDVRSSRSADSIVPQEPLPVLPKLDTPSET